MKGEYRAWQSSGRSVCIKSWNEIQRGQLCRGDDENLMYSLCRLRKPVNNEPDMTL